MILSSDQNQLKLAHFLVSIYKSVFVILEEGEILAKLAEPCYDWTAQRIITNHQSKGRNGALAVIFIMAHRKWGRSFLQDRVNGEITVSGKQQKKWQTISGSWTFLMNGPLNGGFLSTSKEGIWIKKQWIQFFLLILFHPHHNALCIWLERVHHSFTILSNCVLFCTRAFHHYWIEI